MDSDIKYDVVDGIEYRYSSDWINKLEDEFHWQLYWQQQKLMESYLGIDDTALEIGVGTSFTVNYLKSKGIDIKSIDIDEEKKPDIVGNIVNFDWKNLMFDHILAFEVFEHIPFSEFQKTLNNLKKVCKKNLFISLPVNEKVFIELECKLPKLKKFEIRITRKKNKINEKNHFWELGYKEYSQNMIENLFKKNNFKILKKIKKANFIFYALENNIND